MCVHVVSVCESGFCLCGAERVSGESGAIMSLENSNFAAPFRSPTPIFNINYFIIIGFYLRLFHSRQNNEWFEQTEASEQIALNILCKGPIVVLFTQKEKVFPAFVAIDLKYFLYVFTKSLSNCNTGTSGYPF